MTKDVNPEERKEGSPISLRQAFFQAMDESPYPAKVIGERSGVAPTAMSTLKHGRRDFGLSRFQRLVDALPPDAADRFYEILARNYRMGAAPYTALETAVNILPELSDEELIELSAAIAKQATERNCDGQAHFSMVLKLISYLQMNWMPPLLSKISDHIQYLGTRNTN